MKPSTIKNETYLGTSYQYDDTLRVGDVQTMVYSENDAGPFDMTPEERAANRIDYDTPGRVKDVNLTKKELIEMLKVENVTNPKGTTKKLQQKCEMLGLPTKNSVKIIREGWVGKAKGALQILYERGFIDKEHHKMKYTMDGKKSLDGNIIEGS
jgi:hypothetical protein